MSEFEDFPDARVPMRVMSSSETTGVLRPARHSEEGRPPHRTFAEDSENRRASSPIPSTPSRSNPQFASPPASSGSKRTGQYSDRFIPSRNTTNLEDAFDILETKSTQQERLQQQRDSLGSAASSSRAGSRRESAEFDPNQVIINNLIRAELLGQPALDISPYTMAAAVEAIPSNSSNSASAAVTAPNPTAAVSSSSGSGRMSDTMLQSPPRRESSNMFKFRSPSAGGASSNSRISGGSVDYDSLSHSPTRHSSGGRASILMGQKKPSRKISKTPYKVLDAPSLHDDYYLNLVDWSSSNVLSVALGSSVYLWSANTSKVTKLCDFSSADMVTSVAWARSGPHLAVGMTSGKIQIWDCSANKVVRHMKSHDSRVGSLSWSTTMLASGSRDRSIYIQDVRMRTHPSTSSSSSAPADSSMQSGDTTSSTISTPAATTDIRAVSAFTSMQGNSLTNRSRMMSSVLGSPLRATTSSPQSATISGGLICTLKKHYQEVCGLKWSFDEKMLASGGNDNKLFVWDVNHMSSSNQEVIKPLCSFEDHTAAVKAVAWSPHQHGLLASGGGTADKHIRFWNAATGVPLHKVDTGSQVCNLMWSKTVNEIVSTHGYSLNQVIVWKYPSMQKIATLSGHTLRVLYLAMSPDGQTIVTGAGDETLRFWNVFPPPRNNTGAPIGKTILQPSPSDVR